MIIINKYRNKSKRQAGFTLIELMIVIAIIGILISFAMPKFTNVTKKAYETKTLADINTIKNAANLYIAERGGKAITNLTIEQLVKEGYLDQSIKNTNGDKEDLSKKYILKVNGSEVQVEAIANNKE